jgi:ABC-2 type transport system ATP-binding protein
MTDVRLHGLTKTFGRVTAVRDLSVTVTPGVTGFLGPNGAGKTTTLRMLLGLVRPTAGEATVGGRRYADLPHPRRTVGAVLDAVGFHPGRSGRQHLLIAASVAGLPRRRVDEALDAVQLAPADASRRIGSYSLGMRQRLGLANALLGDPEVLMLDEPGNGLDPAGMAWLRRLLRDRAAAGGTVLISSHVLAEVAQTVDRVVIIGGGSLRYAGPLDGLAAGGDGLEDAFLRLTGSAR